MRPKVTIIRTDRLVPKGFGAITIWTWILVRPSARLDEDLLAHELAHVLQWKRHGVLGFLWNYGWTWMRDGFSYHNIDAEEEARLPIPSTREWARTLLRTQHT